MPPVESIVEWMGLAIACDVPVWKSPREDMEFIGTGPHIIILSVKGIKVVIGNVFLCGAGKTNGKQQQREYIFHNASKLIPGAALAMK